MVRGVVPLATSGYSVELEAEAQQWIEEVTGEPFEGEFAKELRDGRRLCLLINAIRPGSVRRVNDSKTPFKQMENISNFLKACRAVGVPEYSLFETVDLFELKDLVLVVKCLVRLRGYTFVCAKALVTFVRAFQSGKHTTSGCVFVLYGTGLGVLFLPAARAVHARAVSRSFVFP